MTELEYPICTKHRDCFANEDGACNCLTDNNFKGRDCPFYKTKQPVKERLRNYLKREDYFRNYP